jgi:hypothetical protein
VSWYCMVRSNHISDSLYIGSDKQRIFNCGLCYTIFGAVLIGWFRERALGNVRSIEKGAFYVGYSFSNLIVHV